MYAPNIRLRKEATARHVGAATVKFPTNSDVLQIMVNHSPVQFLESADFLVEFPSDPGVGGGISYLALCQIAFFPV